jgi:hypothetical protein
MVLECNSSAMRVRVHGAELVLNTGDVHEIEGE